jgi:hypothetical protein
MEEPVKVIIKDLGIIEGLHTWEVIDAETGVIIGFNQTSPQEEETL